MAGANSVASVDPASTTKSYTKPTVYIAPAASITQSGELLRLGGSVTVIGVGTIIIVIVGPLRVRPILETAVP